MVIGKLNKHPIIWPSVPHRYLNKLLIGDLNKPLTTHLEVSRKKWFKIGYTVNRCNQPQNIYKCLMRTKITNPKYHKAIDILNLILKIFSMVIS